VTERAAQARKQAQEAQDLQKQLSETQKMISEGEEKFLAREKALTYVFSTLSFLLLDLSSSSIFSLLFPPSPHHSFPPSLPPPFPSSPGTVALSSILPPSLGSPF
jgi:hypothetical protein